MSEDDKTFGFTHAIVRQAMAWALSSDYYTKDILREYRAWLDSGEDESLHWFCKNVLRIPSE